MSRKTDNIKKSITKLNELKNQLHEYNQQTFSSEIENIEVEMDEQIKNLTFWFESLYSYNGKSTSNAKKSSSRENGKKGGRPPKEVTLRKRRIIELEDVLIPQLQQQKKLAVDFDEESRLESEIKKLEEELQLIQSL